VTTFASARGHRPDNVPTLREDVAVHVGYYLVFVAEFRPLLRSRFVARAYTPTEAAQAGRVHDREVHLASRGTAKKAAHKALCDLVVADGPPLDGLACFRDYEVVRRPGTQVPPLRFRGGPKRLSKALGTSHRVAVSLRLSDEHGYAADHMAISCAGDAAERAALAAQVTAVPEGARG
jgi:phosphopantetheinyl transferase (holo-ACP synthase)